MSSLNTNFAPLGGNLENFSSPEFIPHNHSKVFIEWTNKQHFTDLKEPKSYSHTGVDEPFIIQTDEEFHWALARFNEIMDAEQNSNEALELNALEKAIDIYWDILYPKEAE